MNAIAKRLLLLLITSCSFVALQAQPGRYQYEIGINAGTFLYQGDLLRSKYGSFKAVGPVLQAWVGKPFSSYLSWRANLTIGSLQADESEFSSPSWKQLRNFSFHTPVTELSGIISYNLYGDNGKDDHHVLTPYLMAGFGLGFLQVTRDWSRLDTTLFNNKTTTQIGLGIDTVRKLPAVLPVIPLGAGVRWAITPRLSATAELLFRYTFTDYIDGFSYAADNRNKDTYYSLSLGLSWVLGSDGIRCPRPAL